MCFYQGTISNSNFIDICIRATMCQSQEVPHQRSLLFDTWMACCILCCCSNFDQPWFFSLYSLFLTKQEVIVSLVLRQLSIKCQRIQRRSLQVQYPLLILLKSRKQVSVNISVHNFENQGVTSLEFFGFQCKIPFAGAGAPTSSYQGELQCPKQVNTLYRTEFIFVEQKISSITHKHQISFDLGGARQRNPPKFKHSYNYLY